MNVTILLTSISLVLALIGTLTKTSTETDGKKKLTFWGYIVITLLFLSAGAGFYSADQKSSADKAAAEKLKKRENQQRLLSLLAISDAFEIYKRPSFEISFTLPTDSESNALDTTAQSFPGFGLKDFAYQLNLNITSAKSDSISGSSLPMWEGEESPLDTTETDLKITPLKELTPNEAHYMWELSGYQSLSDVLFDIPADRTIGELIFKKNKGNIVKADFETINKYLFQKGDRCIRLYIKPRNGRASAFPYLEIPVSLELIERKADHFSYRLITGYPQISTYQFDQI